MYKQSQWTEQPEQISTRVRIETMHADQGVVWVNALDGDRARFEVGAQSDDEHAPIQYRYFYDLSDAMRCYRKQTLDLQFDRTPRLVAEKPQASA